MIAILRLRNLAVGIGGAHEKSEKSSKHWSNWYKYVDGWKTVTVMTTSGSKGAQQLSRSLVHDSSMFVHY